jgi:hypothetical protein
MLTAISNEARICTFMATSYVICRNLAIFTSLLRLFAPGSLKWALSRFFNIYAGGFLVGYAKFFGVDYDRAGILLAFAFHGIETKSPIFYGRDCRRGEYWVATYNRNADGLPRLVNPPATQYSPRGGLESLHHHRSPCDYSLRYLLGSKVHRFLLAGLRGFLV